MKLPRKFSLLVQTVLVLISSLLAGCAGAVELPNGRSMTPSDIKVFTDGMSAALRGDYGTYVAKNGENILLAWEQGRGWAFVVFKDTGEPVLDVVDALTGRGSDMTGDMPSFAKFLARNGWELMETKALPEVAKKAIWTAIDGFLSLGADAMPTIIIFPANLLEDNDLWKLIGPPIKG